VKPDADGYTKMLNHHKILWKTQKNNNLPKTKRILQPKCKLSGARFVHFACQWEQFTPLPHQLHHWHGPIKLI